MDTLVNFIQQSFLSIGPFFILLGLLIFVHEMGHFLVAKYCGVRVEVFSLGFGKKIFQLKRGDTIYCISIIPLGGYVKMFGSDPNAEVPEEQRDISFLHKRVGQRIAIILAGPLMNLIFAAFLFTSIAMIGEKVPSPVVGDIVLESEAFKVGFRSGDTIKSINGADINTWEEAQKIIKRHPETPLTFVVQAKVGAAREFQASPSYIPNNDFFSWTERVGGFEGLSILSSTPVVGIPQSDSVAAVSGLRSLDFITHINGKEIRYWRDLGSRLFEESQKGDSLTLTVEPHVSFSPSQKAAKKVDSREVIVRNWKPRSLVSVLDDFGVEKTELYLSRVLEGSPAEGVGLKRGDKVISLQNQPVREWDDVLNRVKSFDASEGNLDFVVLRNGELQTFSIHPKLTELMNQKMQEEKRFTVGIVPTIVVSASPLITEVTLNPFKAAVKGVEKSINWTNRVVFGLVRLVQNKISSRNISSVITIGKVAGQSFQMGITSFLRVMAIISINLFLVNLLPIPLLDGGHLMFLTLEAIRGEPISMKKMELAQQVGLIILMSLMVYALYNDILNLFNPHW